ncbi:MAG TPA: hypothetical protein VF678_02215, partial [bacterium]
MMTDEQGRQVLREAIVRRLEMLRDEYVHWLNEMKRLDDAIATETADGRPIAVHEFLPPDPTRL